MRQLFFIVSCFATMSARDVLAGPVYHRHGVEIRTKGRSGIRNRDFPNPDSILTETSNSIASSNEGPPVVTLHRANPHAIQTPLPDVREPPPGNEVLGSDENIRNVALTPTRPGTTDEKSDDAGDDEVDANGDGPDDYWISSTSVSKDDEDSGRKTDSTTLQTSLGKEVSGGPSGSFLDARKKTWKSEQRLAERVQRLVVMECIKLGVFKLECDYLYSHILDMMKRGRAVYAYGYQRYGTAREIFARDAEKCLDATLAPHAPQFSAAVHATPPLGGAFEFFSCLSKKIAYEAEKLTKIATLLAEIKVEFENMCLGPLSLYCSQHFTTIVEDPIVRLHRYYGIRVSQLRFWTQSILSDCRLKPGFPHCFFQRMLLYEKQTIEKTKHVLVFKARRKQQKNNLLFTMP